jgi:type IV pilus assembly protein PilQ
LALALGGCSNKTKPQDDPFFEKWRAMAEQSQGHTPTQQPLDVTEEQAAQTSEARPERDLPDMVVGSLDMRNANIVAVLRALGRIAGQSIMVSPKVEGLINVSVKDVPWSQVFRGIVRTHGLTYEWEGDILRVMTLADMEESVRLDELRNRQALNSATVRIRYADAAKLRETLAQLLTKDSDGKARGSVELVEHTNSLVIIAVPGDLRKMSQLIEQTDKPSKQIRIKAFIVETTGETARSLGVLWGGAYKRASVGGDGDSLWVTPGGTGAPATPIRLHRHTSGYTRRWAAPRACPTRGLLQHAARSGRERARRLLALMFGTLGGNILEASCRPPGGQQAGTSCPSRPLPLWTTRPP